MSNRNYSNVAPPIALTVGATTSSTTLTVASTTGYPAPPFLIGMERGTANEEVVLATALTSTTFTVQRGYDGTSAKTHALGTQVEHTVASIDYAEAGDHIVASTNVHGVGAGSAVVGTNTEQTLTGKTISGTNNQISNLDAATIVSGVFPAARIPVLDVAKITTGIFDIARIPTGATSTTVALGNHTHTQSQVAGGVLDATTINGRKIWVQSGDPGAAAANGDLWFQPV